MIAMRMKKTIKKIPLKIRRNYIRQRHPSWKRNQLKFCNKMEGITAIVIGSLGK